MEKKFKVVVHHNGGFGGFTHSSYYGLQDSWICDPNVWSYFEVLGDLKEMGYNNLESLWYYDPVLEDEIIRLRDDVGTNRMKNIAYDEGEAHLYVIHNMEEPIVEEYPTLANFIQGPNARGNVGPDVVEIIDCDVVEDNGPDVMDNDTVDMDGGPSNDTVDVDNGPINDTVEDKESGENVVEKESGPLNAFIPAVAINSEGEGVDAINTERVHAELRDYSDEDSALASTFDSEDEIALEDHFDDFALQTDIPSTLPPTTQPNTNSEAASGSKPKKKRGRPRKNTVTELVVVEEAAGADNDIVESSQAPLFGLSDAEDYNSDQLNSDCDSEDDNGQTKTKFQTFKLLDSMRDYKWEVGTFFVTKKAFQVGIRTYAVHNGYDLKFKKNDKKRIRVICKKGICSWKAFCAKIDGEETWQLRKIIDDHTCGREFKVKMLTSKWLGGKLNNTVRENPNIELNKIMTKTQQKWNLTINKTKAYRAKSYAIDEVDGSYRDQYTRMYDYCHELLRSNPNF